MTFVIGNGFSNRIDYEKIIKVQANQSTNIQRRVVYANKKYRIKNANTTKFKYPIKMLRK